MAIIRSATSECAIEKWYTYDQQFQLRVARDHTQKLGSYWWTIVVAINSIRHSEETNPSNNKCLKRF